MRLFDARVIGNRHAGPTYAGTYVSPSGVAKPSADLPALPRPCIHKAGWRPPRHSLPPINSAIVVLWFAIRARSRSDIAKSCGTWAGQAAALLVLFSWFVFAVLLVVAIGLGLDAGAPPRTPSWKRLPARTRRSLSWPLRRRQVRAAARRSLNAIRDASGARPAPVVTRLPKLEGGEGRLARVLRLEV